MKNVYKTTLILYFIFLSCIANAQAPHLEWQNSIAADYWDQISAMIPLPDGGALISIASRSGLALDKTEANHGTTEYEDIWLIKIDVSGNIVWQETYGGALYDYANKIIPTADGGYLLAATSSSNIGFDKTKNSKGLNDIWLIKIDATGNILWQKTIGGDKNDIVYDALQTTDGGFLIGAYSESGISGNKSEALIGTGFNGDIWLVKVNTTGNIQWQNTIGGTGKDMIASLGLTTGGYFVAATSNSPVSGDKTEGVSGSNDVWVMKVNSLGSIQWQNTIGGSLNDRVGAGIVSTSGNFFLGCSSDSGISGDKTTTNYGYEDFWLLMINKNGTIKWQKTYGAGGSDNAYSVVEAPDGGLLIAGMSNSNHNAIKTENGYGNQDYWVLKTTSNGTKLWDNTLGTYEYDYLYKIAVLSDGGILLGGHTLGPLDGVKNEYNYGSFDCWMIRLGANPCTSSPEVCNGFDDDCNDIVDNGFESSVTASTPFGDDDIQVCDGDSVAIIATHDGESIKWRDQWDFISGEFNDIFYAKTGGSYQAEVTSFCGVRSLSDFVTIIWQPSPIALITADGPTTFCDGGNVTLTENPYPGSHYQWYLNEVIISGATSTSYIATLAGTYQCLVTKNATDCTKFSNTITVAIPCKEDEELLNEKNNNFTIYPNPNNGTFNVVFNSPLGAPSPFEGGSRGMISLQIFNSLGQQIHSQQINSPDGNINETISINNYSSGIYFIRINNGNYYSEQKLVIEQ